MTGFKGVIGHQKIIRHLQSAIAANRISHSYIFTGDSGSGKNMLAGLFAMTLQCDEHGTEPCMVCPSCKKSLTRSHPDIKVLTHTKNDSISVDEIREQLISDVSIKPYTGPRKIYIVPDAELMTVQAQNALLKTIEEPPEYAVIILLTQNPDILLPTILSRCVLLHLKPLDDDQVITYLVDNLSMSYQDAQLSAQLAQGSIGKAIDIAESEQFQRISHNAVALLKRLGNMSSPDFIDAIKKLVKDKDNISDYLEIFDIWFRDVLIFKATQEVDSLSLRGEINSINDYACEHSYESLQNSLMAIKKAKIRLDANVNFELAMDLMFQTFREK